MGYLEDDIELQPLTPNGMIHGANISLSKEEQEEQDEAKAMVKQARYLKRCKDVMWKDGYRNMFGRYANDMVCPPARLNVGDVVLLQGEEKNRGLWKMGVVEKLISRKDGVIRGAILKTGNGRKERPLQHLYPLELSSARTKSHRPKALNPRAEIFELRKSRAMKTKALETDSR